MNTVIRITKNPTAYWRPTPVIYYLLIYSFHLKCLFLINTIDNRIIAAKSGRIIQVGNSGMVGLGDGDAVGETVEVGVGVGEGVGF